MEAPATRFFEPTILPGRAVGATPLRTRRTAGGTLRDSRYRTLAVPGPAPGGM